MNRDKINIMKFFIRSLNDGHYDVRFGQNTDEGYQRKSSASNTDSLRRVC